MPGSDWQRRRCEIRLLREAQLAEPLATRSKHKPEHKSDDQGAYKARQAIAFHFF